MKAKKAHQTLLEHYLVPVALFLLNINLVHVIYAYSTGNWNNHWHLIALTTAFVALGSALMLKNANYLILSILYYIVVLACCLN